MKKLTFMVVFFVGFSIFALASAEMTVQFVDVGQGDCTIIQSDDKTFLIDTGPSEAKTKLSDQLIKCGIKSIDVLVLTHPHDDHDGNFGYLLHNFKIGQLYMPEYPDDEEDYGALLRLAVGRGTQIIYPTVGDQISVGDAIATILSAADPTQFPDERNLWSIVIRIDCGKTTVLVMGDAEDINEYAMIDAGADLNADILRVGHHGSNTSTSGDFLDAVTPGLAVISCGADNSYGHPNQETLNSLCTRGIVIFQTDLQGTITVSVENEGYTISTEK